MNQFLRQIRQHLNNQQIQVTLLGPAPSPMEKKAGQYRMQLLIQAPQRRLLADCIHQIRGFVQQQLKETRLHWSIDIDPIDLD